VKIGLRGGHSANCLGAVGLRNEYEQMQSLYRYVKDTLEKHGHEVIDCNSNANTESSELREGTTNANSNKVDLYLSLHMNSFNGNAHGTEAWVYKDSGLAYNIANKMTENYEKLGFYNRGVKVSTGLHDLKYSYAPAIIFETCFCDSEKDIEIWSPDSWKTLSFNICNAIDDNIKEKEIIQEVKSDIKATTKNVTTGLNIRECPSDSSKIITSIKPNGLFHILWTEIGWHFVSYYDYLGYVSADYVKLLE